MTALLLTIYWVAVGGRYVLAWALWLYAVWIVIDIACIAARKAKSRDNQS